MRRNRWSVLPVALLLSACAGQRAVERASYDLSGGESVARPPALHLRLDVRMAAWLDNNDIAYRLHDDPPGRLRAYADSRWAGKAGQLVGERLQAALGAQSVTAPCTLRVEIGDFAQQFDTPTSSRFVLAARWSLTNTKGERLHADARGFSVAAPSADARGGVVAAQRALGELAVAVLTAAAQQSACR